MKLYKLKKYLIRDIEGCDTYSNLKKIMQYAIQDCNKEMKRYKKVKEKMKRY